MSHRFFTSESVTEGHPDKICDQISDAVLDAILAQDPTGRVACETTASTGLIHIMGEISTSCYVDIPKIARQVIREIGYDRAKYGFDCDTCGIITNIDEQSADIALGVDQSLEAKAEGDSQLDNGAGDQGMMFGYACDETPECMPLAISLAHKMAQRLTQVRKEGQVDYLRPDGKTQVTVEYDENNQPVRVDTVVLSTQHSPKAELDQIRKDMIERVIRPTVPAHLMDENTKIYVNPTGRFVIGGPQGDTGLTGRKIIVDTYGGSAPHGGGAFSGKDPTKVDRSAAYAARWVAKPWWPPGWPSGARFSWPTPSVWPSRFPSWWRPSAPAPWRMRCWRSAVRKTFDLRPTAIIRDLGLQSPFTGSWPPMATWGGRTWGPVGENRPGRAAGSAACQ